MPNRNVSTAALAAIMTLSPLMRLPAAAVPRSLRTTRFTVTA